MIPNAGGVAPGGNALISVDNIRAQTFSSVPGRIDIYTDTTTLSTNTQYLLVIDDAGSSTSLTTGQIYRLTTATVNAVGSSFTGAALVTDGQVGATRTFAESNPSDVDISIFAVGTSAPMLSINNSTDSEIASLNDAGDLTLAGSVNEAATVTNSRTGTGVTIWAGTRDQFNGITEVTDGSVIYIIQEP